MWRIITLLSFLTLAGVGRAQLVSIPDMALAAKLYNLCPLAVDTVAQTIDSSHPQALAITTLDVMYYTPPISDLTGLDGLANLTTLRLRDETITTINALPATITELRIDDCAQLTDIQSLPPALETLILYDCEATLSTTLPNSLKHLHFVYWNTMPSTIDWPDSLLTVSMSSCPMTIVQGLPETVEELVIGNNGLVGIVDSNSQPHLPDALLSLNIQAHQLTQLPPLPTGLTNLFSVGGFLTSLPALPGGLLDLYVEGSDITALPILPNGLQTLAVPYAPITTLPSLPASLSELDVHSTLLTSLPVLPAGLGRLNVYATQLTALPTLPAALWRLEMSSNPGITSLPTLTSTSLQVLLASHSGLLSLPQLPVTLGTLDVDDNPLSTLPTLPASLEYLTASNTGLAQLPVLPLGLVSCEVYWCTGLTCAPWLPPGLTTFNAYNTGINCIPNQPAGLDIGSLGFPLVICDILAPCPTLNPAMMGTSYVDLDNDGTRDSGEPALPNATVEVTPDNFVGGTGADGRYVFGLDVGTYTVTGIPALYQTISSASASATFTAWQQIDSLNDVGFYLIPNIQDLVMGLTDLTAERPGFDTQYALSYRNVGTQVQDGSINFTYDAAMTFVSSVPAPDVINGNTLTWNFTLMQMGEQRSIDLTLNTPVGTALGTLVSHTVTADPLATDQTPVDNTYLYYGEVVGSYDPNDKVVEPTGLLLSEVAAGERVNYTVRFQNTGTFQATRVIVTDTLSSDLQWSTMQLVAASHAQNWYIHDGVLHVIFDNINLPDSNANEPASHGFVKFSMKPVSTLMLGASVSNTANIYFDFNEPVITNAAVFSVNNNVLVSEVAAETLSLSPNPVSDVLNIALDKSAADLPLSVVDLTGRVVLTGSMNGPRAQLNVQALRAGSYQLRMGERMVGRFVKK
ncbi:MAG: T9SS type A sorting domain-containing protein [Flavobacteriales bacterium]